MSLQKGFLRAPEFRLTGWHIFSALVISSLVALLFHGLFVFVREAMRIGVMNYNEVVLLLNQQELHIYDTALAALSGAIGQGFAIKILLQHISRKTPPKIRHSQRFVRDQTSYTLWIWLFYVGKVLSLLGILYAAFHIHYDFDLLREFWVLIWGIPLVWFLNNWLNIYRLLRKQYFKWFFMGLIHWLVISLMLGRYQWTDNEAIENTIKANTIELRYEMQYAEAQSLLTKEYIPDAVFYFVYQNDQAKVILDDYWWKDRPVSLNGLQPLFNVAFDNRWGFHKAVLIIDAKVPLKEVLRFEKELARSDVHKVFYNLAIKNSKYPRQYANMMRWGMPKWLPRLCEDERSNLDSLRQLGYKAAQIRWPEWFCYEMPFILQENRVLVGRTKEGFTLNNSAIGYQVLLDKLTQLRKKYERDLIVLYQPAPELSFGEYIEGRDLIQQSAIKNRVRQAWAEKGLDYKYCEGSFCGYPNQDYYESLHQKFPTYLVELTGWNLELYNYLKDQP